MARIIAFCVFVFVLNFNTVSQQTIEATNALPSKTQKGNVKSRTFYDYQTRIAAFKDVVESRCLLEFLKNGESLISENFEKARLDNLPKTFFMSENQLSKRQIWTLGGQRITDFCRGFPTYLIQELKSEKQQDTILNDVDIVSIRKRRDTKHFFVGRVRGQSQSQYLNFGNSKDPGKAEAESTYGSSKAVVSGNSGMGQAQSQSSPYNCEECYGQEGQNYDRQSQGLQFGKPGGIYPDLQQPLKPDQIVNSRARGGSGSKVAGQPISGRPTEISSYPGQQSSDQTSNLPNQGITTGHAGQFTDNLGGVTNYPGQNVEGIGGQVYGYPGQTPGYFGKQINRPGQQYVYSNQNHPTNPTGQPSSYPQQLPSPSNQQATYVPRYPGQTTKPQSPDQFLLSYPNRPGHITDSAQIAGGSPDSLYNYPGQTRHEVLNPPYPVEAKPVSTDISKIPPYPTHSANSQKQNQFHTSDSSNVDSYNSGKQGYAYDGKFSGQVAGEYDVQSGKKGKFSGIFSGQYENENRNIQNGIQGPSRVGLMDNTQQTAGQMPSGYSDQSLPKQVGQLKPNPIQDSTSIQSEQFPSRISSQNDYGQTGQSTGQSGQFLTGRLKPTVPNQPVHRVTDQYVSGQPGQIVHGKLGQAVPGVQQTILNPMGYILPGQPSQYVTNQLGQYGAEQFIPGQPKQNVPGQPGQLILGQSGPFAPDQSRQSLPEQPQHSTFGHSGQSTYEQPGKSTFGQPEQFIPGQPGQLLPSQPGQSILGHPGQSIPGQFIPVQSIPAQPGQVVPGRLGQFIPGQHGQPISGQPGQLISGQQGQYIPRESGQFIPGQPGQLIPDQPGQPIPGQPGQFIPEQPGQLGHSMAGQPGQTMPGQPRQPVFLQPNQPGYVTYGVDQGYVEQYDSGQQGASRISGQINPQQQNYNAAPGLSNQYSQNGLDDADSQVQTSVQQVDNKTQANAAAQGKYQGGTAQSQVSGTYAGTGSFSASAGSDDGKRGAMTQIAGGKEGAISAAQGRGGLGQSQAQVQLSSDTGDTVSSAQTGGYNHGSQTQVNAGGKGGLADAQANGPGSTSSQAQIGFAPYDENQEDNQNSPFKGGGMASAQSGTHSGQSQSQIQGQLRYGIKYIGAAQAGSGRKITPLNQTAFEQSSGAFPFQPIASLTKTKQKPESHQTVTSHSKKQTRKSENFLVPSKQDERSVPVNQQENNYDYNEEYEEADYESESEKPEMKNILSQKSKHQNQQIILDPLEDLDATVYQSNGDFPKDGTVLQPGELIPGSPGYQIPEGFRGKVRSIANGPNTYTSGKHSQAQSVTLSPGTGKIIHRRPIYAVSSRTHLQNGQIGYGSGYTYQPAQYQVKSGRSLPNFVSVTKSETGSKNLFTGKKTPSVYYSQSSSCGVFTNTCVFNATGKVCFPKPKTNPDGTLMTC